MKFNEDFFKVNVEPGLRVALLDSVVKIVDDYGNVELHYGFSFPNTNYNPYFLKQRWSGKTKTTQEDFLFKTMHKILYCVGLEKTFKFVYGKYDDFKDFFNNLNAVVNKINKDLEEEESKSCLLNLVRKEYKSLFQNEWGETETVTKEFIGIDILDKVPFISEHKA